VTVAAREIHLKSRPSGTPGPDNFALVERTLPDLADGQLLAKALWMSVDPYMRGRMSDRPSYIAPFQLGQPLEGDTIGVVEESRDDRFKPGDVVKHFFGWRDRAIVDATAATRIDPAALPLPAWLGPLGIPGLTARAGLTHIAKLKEGETVFVSGARGCRLDGRSDREDQGRARRRFGRYGREGALGEGRTRRRRRHQLQDGGQSHQGAH